MKTHHYKLAALFFVTGVCNYRQCTGKKKQKPAAELNKADTIAHPKKSQRADAVRINKELNVVNRHKRFDSARVYKEVNIERKHKRADSARNSNRDFKWEGKQAPSKKHLEKVKSKKIVKRFT